MIVVVDAVVDVDVNADVTVVVDAVVDVNVNVDVTVVDVDIDGSGVDVTGVDIIVIVTVDGDVLVVIFSGFVGARMTNFNNKERVTAIIVKTIKEIPMILIQR